MYFYATYFLLCCYVVDKMQCFTLLDIVCITAGKNSNSGGSSDAAVNKSRPMSGKTTSAGCNKVKVRNSHSCLNLYFLEVKIFDVWKFVDEKLSEGSQLPFETMFCYLGI